MEKIKIIKPLGSGGNSNAFLGKEEVSGRKVTVKMCKSASEKTVEKANMENEARILADLRHKGIPRLYSRCPDGIVLEYIPGNSLEKVLMKKGVFSEKEAVRIGVEIAEILRYLHGRREPVIYRDLKPANVVLRPDGHVSLIDFGAARIYEMGEKSDTLNLGTLGFAAPEQFGNLGQTDPRTDIYCFGMTLLQLVSGVDTKDMDQVSSFLNKGIKGVSPELLRIIRKCTRPDREDRFKSAKEIQKALLEYPKKVRVRKIKGVIKVSVAAIILSAVISGCIVKADSISSYAQKDMEVRMPAVKERLFLARVWIEDKIEDLLDSEEVQKK